MDFLFVVQVAPGRRAVVFSTSDETAATVSDLARTGIAIAAVSLGFNLLGDGLRDVLDPKQR